MHALMGNIFKLFQLRLTKANRNQFESFKLLLYSKKTDKNFLIH